MKESKHWSLTLLFASLTLGVLMASVAAGALVLYLVSFTSFFPIDVESGTDILISMLIVGVVCLLVGALLAMVIVRIPLKPINRLINQMNRLAAGDFSARLEFNKPLGSIPAFREVVDSFNKMASELGNTEVLRSDFLNNYSHEIKTPLVSITGFAKLLQKGVLTESQQQEYIDAIVEESVRLSRLAQNVLNLTKVENRTILTNITRFNLSEQIRSAVLLLENSWTKKHLELEIDFPEVEISGNEELLKEVWINLLHNAVKFSPDYGPLRVEIQQEEAAVTVTVRNSGDIPEEALSRVWNKFYQGDKSHSGDGSGVGLAIVRRIVELHKGTASVTSHGGIVSFSVTLPR